MRNQVVSKSLTRPAAGCTATACASRDCEWRTLPRRNRRTGRRSGKCRRIKRIDLEQHATPTGTSSAAR